MVFSLLLFLSLSLSLSLHINFPYNLMVKKIIHKKSKIPLLTTGIIYKSAVIEHSVRTI